MRKLLALIIALTFTQPAYTAYNFDGSNDVVTLGTSDDFMLNGNPFSALVVFNARSTGEGGAGRMLDSMTDGFIGFIQCRLGGTNQITMACDGGTTDMERTSDTNAYNNNQWYRAVFTGDGGTTATNYHIYLNGAEVTYATSTNLTGGFASGAGATRKIGNTVSGLNTFDGMISEVAIWNVQLTKAEAIALTSPNVRRMPLQVRPASLKGYWPLDEFGQGVTASGTGASKDRSGNGRHGTPTNSPSGRPDIIAYP